MSDNSLNLQGYDNSQNINENINFSNNNGNEKKNVDCRFDLNGFSRLQDDKCHKIFRDKQSEGPGTYRLNELYNTNMSCGTPTCNIPEVIEVASQNPTIVFKDGYGVSDCNIDKDSEMRIGKTKRNPKVPNQLFTRPYKTVPFMGRGCGNSFLESQLQPGEDSSDKRQCNTLAGISIDNLNPSTMPMVDHLKYNIQNPSNLITEEAMEGWIRGGAPSRQIVKDIEYLERCGSKYQKMAAEKYGNYN